MDEYVNATLRLFSRFGHDSGFPSNVCVLWRTSNVGPRHASRSSLHHPSARNGVHEWLNRFTSALARRSGLGVVDTTDITYRHPPPQVAQKVSRRSTSTEQDLKGVEGSVNGHSSQRASTLLEGDLYHGYQASLLLEPVCLRACSRCGLPNIARL